MAEAAITMDRTIPVYCGPGGSVSVPYRQGEPVSAFFDKVVNRLRASRAWADVTTLDIALWCVTSVDDLEALQAGERASERRGFKKLKGWQNITADTFASSCAIWVELLGGIGAGGGEWDAAPGGSPRGTRCATVNPARLALTHATRAACKSSHPCPLPLNAGAPAPMVPTAAASDATGGECLSCGMGFGREPRESIAAAL
jgi:hypothetical protein